ncbi:glucokinase, partial [Pseudoalteromonas sp. S4491]|uniref:glucokinase n=1 Tax=Pseudoalteromonas sp. S4491 TaxID=579559 RepID=UPI001276D587
AACLGRTSQGSAVLSCEAGLFTLAAVTELDRQIITELKLQLNHVSVDTGIAGPGIAPL